MRVKLWVWLFLFLLVGAIFALNKNGTSYIEEMQQKIAKAKAANILAPATNYKTHNMGQLYFTICNWGVFGSQRGQDDPRYCDPFIDTEGEFGDPGGCLPSAEYPGGSGIEYLFQGSLWIGAVVDGDTLVSIGEDGWFTGINELLPSRLPDDTMKIRSINNDDEGAISEQDFVCHFSDTCVDPNFVPSDHIPIGIAVTQKSYSWSYGYAQNFIIIDYWFKNIRDDGKTISDMYIGIYVDGDVGHVQTPDYAQDDINGFLETYEDHSYSPPREVPIMLAWLADNDGDPVDNAFDDYSPTGAMGVRVLRSPFGANIADLDFSFNWWISNTDEALDWGPMLRVNQTNWDGTPETDKQKYEVLSNGEKDFPQTDISEHSGDPWTAPPSNWQDLADGYDTRFLLSFGALTIAPGDSVPVTIAFLVGEHFHTDPTNTPNAANPERWTSRFNHDGLGYAANWVYTVFDNPGVDTDGDGYRGDCCETESGDCIVNTFTGDTIYCTGDGVPDYQGPIPPPIPHFEVERGPYEITIYWKGDSCEDFQDPITGLYDFDSYRIYIASVLQDRYFIPLVQYDKVDYCRYDRVIEDSLGTKHIYYSDEFSAVDTPYTITIYNAAGDTLRDSTFTHMTQYGENTGLPQKVYHNGDSVYSYTISNLRPGADRYVVVTAFDFGKPSVGLTSLQSNKVNAALWIVPQGTGAESGNAYVWPNPYRADRDYSGEEGLWAEGSPVETWTEYSRKLHFVNLPPKCMLRIYTLDGDLVKEIEHDDDNPDAIKGGEIWDMINRNNQSIASGIYIFSVENTENNDIQTGKFVVIK